MHIMEPQEASCPHCLLTFLAHFFYSPNTNKLCFPRIYDALIFPPFHYVHPLGFPSISSVNSGLPPISLFHAHSYFV